MKAHTSETQATITPARALELLKEGNHRFVNNLRINRNLLQQANETRDGQWPFATIVSCIDSRTSAELVFDQGLGDILSVRIAGNVVNTDIVGSLEFACQLAGSRLLSKIQPAVYEEGQTVDPAERTSANAGFVERVARLNVRRSVRAIVNRSQVLGELIEAGRVAVIGGMHDLESGEVTFYNDTWVGDAASLRAMARATSAPVLRVSATSVAEKPEPVVVAKADPGRAPKAAPADAVR